MHAFYCAFLYCARENCNVLSVFLLEWQSTRYFTKLLVHRADYYKDGLLQIAQTLSHETFTMTLSVASQTDRLALHNPDSFHFLHTTKCSIKSRISLKIILLCIRVKVSCTLMIWQLSSSAYRTSHDERCYGTQQNDSRHIL